MDKKLLVVCGPTATGKTSLGLRIGKKLGGDIISADSRQVYKEMDIGTGKDLPKDAKYKKEDGVGGYYEVEGIKIWGYDLVSPKEEFSVADYVPIAREVIRHVWQKDKLPILVGGTGLYIEGVVDGIETVSIPRDEKLRERVDGRKAEELYEQLAQLDPIKAASLNTSDKKNPRRLVRAIEIAQWKVKGKEEKEKEAATPLDPELDSLFVGLRADKEKLCNRVEERVEERLEEGIKQEITTLLKKGVTWEDQSMDSLGYKQWKAYFEKEKDEEQIVEDWINEECNYAKRQMTWFKKDKRIEWFDVFDSKYPENVEKKAKKWYNN